MSDPATTSISPPTGADVSAWLQSLGYDARPMVERLQVQGMQRHPQRRYDGAEYRGSSTSGETRFYLLGAFPWSYERNRRTVFRLPSDERDWFVATYSVENNTPPGYPFGEFFILAPWTAGEPIDAHERTPRPRVRLEWAADRGEPE